MSAVGRLSSLRAIGEDAERESRASALGEDEERESRASALSLSLSLSLFYVTTTLRCDVRSS